jgi:alkanesulfonate monooxygenase SsuD/methylene tetrahydromethanopterin reductase-like flavin-dependent oxidoreductase (luciferase family)
MACINVIAAETDLEAERVATSFYQLAMGIVRGKTKPLPPPVATMDGIWSEFEEAAVKSMMAYAVIGSRQTVKEALSRFVEETGMDELMIVSHIYDPAARIKSYQILADLFK